ncbi:MAG: ATP-binding protein [Acidobacteriaceae bacterium]|nr:ATP-binding protein [Acidobacteriaceae bacterium]
MLRSLFTSLFVRILIALAPVAAVFVWVPRQAILSHWIISALALIAWTALHASLFAQSIRRSLLRLEAAVTGIQHVQQTAQPLAYEAIRVGFSDFEDLAYDIAQSSNQVRHLLDESSDGRRRLEAMIDSMQDAVVAVDQAGRIRWANKRTERLVPGASVGRAVRVGYALVQTVRDPEVLECVRAVLERRVVDERRTTSLVPGRIFEAAAAPMPGGGAVLVLHDITRIEQVERTQRDFVANVSHELRTPLTSIAGYVETLLDHEDGLSRQAREFLSTIHKNATRMGRLTEDLLVMTRVESSDHKLNPEPTCADALVRDAVQAMRGLAQDDGATLEIGETTSSLVMSDNDSMIQVLSNLIENGIKYGKTHGDGASRVIVSAAEAQDHAGNSNGMVEFRVRDFGPGIASEHLDRIFERFYRVDKARSRASGGTGLGLAIARHVVQMHGGSIRAESQLNSGSTFIFTLPKAYPAS